MPDRDKQLVKLFFLTVVCLFGVGRPHDYQPSTCALANLRKFPLNSISSRSSSMASHLMLGPSFSPVMRPLETRTRDRYGGRFRESISLPQASQINTQNGREAKASIYNHRMINFRLIQDNGQSDAAGNAYSSALSNRVGTDKFKRQKGLEHAPVMVHRQNGIGTTGEFYRGRGAMNYKMPLSPIDTKTNFWPVNRDLSAEDMVDDSLISLEEVRQKYRLTNDLDGHGDYITGKLKLNLFNKSPPVEKQEKRRKLGTFSDSLNEKIDVGTQKQVYYCQKLKDSELSEPEFQKPSGQQPLKRKKDSKNGRRISSIGGAMARKNNLKTEGKKETSKKSVGNQKNELPSAQSPKESSPNLITSNESKQNLSQVKAFKNEDPKNSLIQMEPILEPRKPDAVAVGNLKVAETGDVEEKKLDGGKQNQPKHNYFNNENENKSLDKKKSHGTTNHHQGDKANRPSQLAGTENLLTNSGDLYTMHNGIIVCPQTNTADAGESTGLYRLLSSTSPSHAENPTDTSTISSNSIHADEIHEGKKFHPIVLYASPSAKANDGESVSDPVKGVKVIDSTIPVSLQYVRPGHYVFANQKKQAGDIRTSEQELNTNFPSILRNKGVRKAFWGVVQQPQRPNVGSSDSKEQAQVSHPFVESWLRDKRHQEDEYPGSEEGDIHKSSNENFRMHRGGAQELTYF